MQPTKSYGLDTFYKLQKRDHYLMTACSQYNSNMAKQTVGQ